MAKTVPLDARTLDWARRFFASYYAATPVDPPPRLARREFAVFPFTRETLMRRHASFRSAGDLREFLQHEAPRHVYYSCAYYRFPDNPTMAAKEWLGADLIFDLDADHLRGAEKTPYASQLELVKDRVRDLYDDFLRGDFGIAEDQLSLVFSGGRGYHVHVHDPAFWPLNSPERRELVEYIQGTGFDAQEAVVTERGGPSSDPGEGDETGRSRTPRSKTFRRLAAPTSPGWRGRTTRSLFALLERWDGIGAAAAAAEMQLLGVAPAEARALARKLVDQGRGRQIRESLSLDVFRREIPEGFLEKVLRHAAIVVQGETDAPVTTDVHRLIRLPGSLHGGTGFRVVPISRAGLDRFDPWRSAVVPSPRSEHERVELLESVDYVVDGANVTGTAGDAVELPRPAAAFLVLRGEAQLPPAAG